MILIVTVILAMWIVIAIVVAAAAAMIVMAMKVVAIYALGKRRPTQLKQQASNPQTTKQNQEEIRRKESEMEHAPGCPYRGSHIPKNRCRYKCWLASPSLDLDPPMAQRFQTLDREMYMRGYESSEKQKHYW
ncbi:uncharacterized protein LOC110625222 isoform X2 [Manihot esculenta]|uniref:Uncharacterized protein n=1 Tax=Manihot esculenta TaxID=3983 RepID=A0A2C9V5F9_MANES|nr:uncharacterized protein LOC110625222 isoform X2 [Manihot esculenta]